MDTHLKARLQDAAFTADSIYQRKMSDAIRDGIAEIERLHEVMAGLKVTTENVAAQMQTILPLLRRIEQPTDEMRAAMESDTPFVWRRKLDKNGYEVIRQNSPDWREVISDDITVVFEGSAKDAEIYCAQCDFYCRYFEMLRVAGEQTE